ncbi:unnamed protein product [Fraxinus pennsylvanica]|uniref:Purple acid phosphatase C-terminal domain-containing protein n=1 Tax=Fraxinus pennsylvanica TaxID=56036 RepID=A0AAD2A6Z3_9LAMI|nr:unnamed protein product [Fraxinus pennsylvanica]
MLILLHTFEGSMVDISHSVRCTECGSQSIEDSQDDIAILLHKERISNIKYNVTNNLNNPVKDASAPVYITIGDGRNIEGIANNFSEPQPSYSAFREVSFGHAILEIKNRNHAFYTWYRNQENEPIAADSTWFYNRYWYPHEEPCSTKN